MGAFDYLGFMSVAGPTTFERTMTTPLRPCDADALYDAAVKREMREEAMTTEPMTPASFHALAKLTLGWEHPNVRIRGDGRATYVQGVATGVVNEAVLTDADALDLLAAGAWRVMRERWPKTTLDYGVIEMWTPTGPGSAAMLLDHYMEEVVECENDEQCWMFAADPANVYALYAALKAKGVRCAT